ncbi:MAG: hypothetical protein WEG36_00850 [Gemmatimonadota bacterium]
MSPNFPTSRSSVLAFALGALSVNACTADAVGPIPSLSVADQSAEAPATIAGDPGAIELVSICPADFPDATAWKVGVSPDANGNGIVCVDFAGKDATAVDDILVDDRGGKGLAGGHGNFVDRGKNGLPDISFLFHGRQTGARGEAKGKFEYHHVGVVRADNPNAGPDLTVHGEVLCLFIVGNTARFIGVVTRSNDKPLPVGQFVAWVATDNGEGGNDPADRVSTLFPTKLGKNTCDVAVKQAPTHPIVGGNLQVH